MELESPARDMRLVDSQVGKIHKPEDRGESGLNVMTEDSSGS